MIWPLTYKALALVFARINDGPGEVRWGSGGTQILIVAGFTPKSWRQMVPMSVTCDSIQTKFTLLKAHLRDPSWML